MERREFLKLTLGFTAAAGSIAAMAATAQAAPMLPTTGDMGSPAKAEANTAEAKSADSATQEKAAPAAHNDLNAVEDTDMSAHRRRRRWWRRRVWRRPRWHRRRRVIHY